MIVQLFGALDLFAGILLILSRFGYLTEFMLFIGILLLIKSLAFFGGVVSVVDAFGALLMIVFAYFTPQAIIAMVFALWFLQKGFFSLMPS